MDSGALDRSELGAYYARILAEQERTGASMREVAWKCGVTPATLYAWRRRLRERAARGGGLVAVNVVGRAGVARGAADSGGYEIVLPNGVTVRAPRDFDAGRVRELLDLVRAC